MSALATSAAEPRVTSATPQEMRRAARAQERRLADGGLIDRKDHRSFTFDGKSYEGFGGDTLASALLANGVHLVGRSFKYHRPRGILSAGPEEPNALVELRSGSRREPNTRATVAELFDGLAAQSQNRWPSLRFDAMALTSLLSPVFAAGFYYKTFMWPKSFWEKVYEPLIRRAAGLGRAADAPDPDTYEKCFAHCDVLVIGAGPAGLTAAIAAARSGARVILCEEDFALGGHLLADRREIAGSPAHLWAASIEAELASLPNVRILRRTSVFGVYDHGAYAAVERVSDHLAQPPAFTPRQRVWNIVAKRCVLAAGSIERPLVFGDNDRPGVMLAGAVRAYLNRFAVACGRRVVIFANNDDSARTALDLHAAGATVVAIIDPRDDDASPLRLAAEHCGARFVSGVVTRAHGSLRVQGVDVRAASGETLRFDCDLAAMSGGWSPSVHLTSHLGGRPVWNEALAAFVPGTLPPRMAAIGACSGDFPLAACLSAGLRAGGEAASACGFAPRAMNLPPVDEEYTSVTPLWRVKGAKGKSFIDFQNDVTAKDIELSEREGFRAVEHLKRYTTLGMATDQGKTANVNGLAIMAELTQQTIAQTGTTRFRPPFTPVAIGALAGHHRGKDLKPARLLPSHAWAQSQGAVDLEAGLWMRPAYFPRSGEPTWFEAACREVLAVRAGAGVCDVSSLGKIDLQGPDAAVFLDRLYCNTLSTLSVGKARYGLMLREDGFVFDDGTVARLGPAHYFITTTTANAARVMQHMDFCHQALWPELDVQFVSVTEQWAQYSIAGPRAREVVRVLIDARHDLSNEAFPYMSARAFTALGGLPARLYRISFSGELAYEIGMPARFGDALIRAIMSAGAAHDITPYGIEALTIMRIEKGHVGGNELNGQTTARDIGLGKMMSAKKDYIGRVMAARPALVAPERPVLVGFKAVNASDAVGSGAHFLRVGAAATAANDEGRTTSVCWSPSLRQTIGMGLLSNGALRVGEKLRAYDPLRKRDTLVEICPPVFVDPEGTRLRG